MTTKFKLTKELANELKDIYHDYYITHKDDENKVLIYDEDESKMVTVSSCIDFCNMMIRIPTESYCGEKVYPRDIGFISDYSEYEKKCLFVILKEYGNDLCEEILKYLREELNYECE